MPVTAFHEAIARYWCYTSFRPLQLKAMDAALEKPGYNARDHFSQVKPPGHPTPRITSLGCTSPLKQKGHDT